MLGHATEHLAERTNEGVGGLLNATFGNAPELIITIVALKAGLFEMVRASLAGAVLANLLLALGIAFLLGGIRYHEQEYNPIATRAYSTMMLIAVISITSAIFALTLFGHYYHIHNNPAEGRSIVFASFAINCV
jgi:Ca2+:H+ antiporter